MPTKTARSRFASEGGFTLIELLVAMTLLVLGIFATVASFDSSRNLGDVSEHQAAAAHFAERDLESLLSRPYNEIALGTNPNTDPRFSTWTSIGNSNLPSTPSDERALGDEVLCTAVSTGATAAASDCPLVGTIAPVSTWSDDKLGIRGVVYRYISWVDDASCPDARCPGTHDYKRITVAVTITTQSGATPTLMRQGPKKAVVVSSVKFDPLRVTGGTNAT